MSSKAGLVQQGGIFTTSLTNKLQVVDAAGIGRRNKLLPREARGRPRQGWAGPAKAGQALGRYPDVANIKERSAEAIVVGGNEPSPRG